VTDNPIRTFLQFLTGSLPDQVHLGDTRWFTVALYWILLLGSLSVAYTNWKRDPGQRSLHHVGIYGMRLAMAGMW
jgi:hypothetical protein